MKKKSDRILIDGNVNPYNLGAYQQFEEYLVMKNISEATIYGYKTDLFQFFRFLNTYRNDIRYTDITVKDVEEYVKFCMSNGNNEDRMHRRISSVSSFIIFLRRKNMINNNPLEFFDRPKKKIGVMEKHFLSKEQVNELKKKLSEQDDLRLEVYALLSLSTAGRRNAIRNIKWSDIDFNTREISVIEKGPQEATLLFSEEVKEKLLELKEYYRNNSILTPYVFSIIYRGNVKQVADKTLNVWAHRVGDLIGITTFTPHSFRRTTANLLKESGVPLEVISVILNHKDTKVTQVYLKNDFSSIKNIKDRLAI